MPVIVTLIEEEVQFYQGMAIVPILKLNSFLGEVEQGLALPTEAMPGEMMGSSLFSVGN